MEMESMNYIDVLEAVEVEEWEDDVKCFPWNGNSASAASKDI